MNRLQKLIFACCLTVVVAASFVVILKDDEQRITRTKTTHINTIFGSPGKKVFEPVLPDRVVTLPTDFRSHPEFQHEWWQLVTQLKDVHGQTYWMRWRFFRYASDDRIKTGWKDPQIYISNVVLTSHLGMFTDQRIARGGIGQAGGVSRPFRVWIDDWSWRSLSHDPMPGNLKLSTDKFSVNLQFEREGEYAVTGEHGYHLKHDLLPRASYVIEAPFVHSTGQLTLPSGKVLKVTGKAWLSKEWGSELVGGNYVGEDNFIIRLSATRALVVSQYRYKDNMPYVSASLIDNNGDVTAIGSDEIELKALNFTALHDGASVPLNWKISIPEHDIDLVIKAGRQVNWVNFVVPQWQGPVRTQGSHVAPGYIQLSGY
ncbi:lipocalin-like domain-containing protein [Vibrio methylphosphonaticus]|uniref:lipocalin-like domain-containing protein n=1 Tax=Vibrio methylphosphonaticus TaxID=2946866 RepID=UPI00202AAAB1|nr:lipocalin-like domain-containing protein [Vibrio methylphosphonaticus]MCL9774907.1 carotenoid 1,2-hydratase [Vibrio methylphosphonaticus]